MTNQPKTIVVLGAYGHAGSKIVKGLIEKTPFHVHAVGRKLKKLNALQELISSDRLTVAMINVNNKEELKRCCQKADLAINAVGPYSMGGIEIAKTVLSCRKPYIDLANEQLHLNNLRQIRQEIENSGTMVFTSVGQSPGISTLLMIHLSKMLHRVDSIEMYGVMGRLPTPDQSLGSMMSGALEAALHSTTYIDGQHVHEKIGSYVKPHTLPKPFGTMNMLSVPLSDAILVSEMVSCKSVRTLFGLKMEVPRFLFKIIALLKPHKHPLTYKFLERIMKNSLKDSYQKGRSEGFNPGGYMKVAVNGNRDIAALIKVEDNSVMTSYMPVVIALNYFENPQRFKGLLTPADIYTFELLNSELEKLGWGIDIQMSEHR